MLLGSRSQDCGW